MFNFGHFLLAAIASISMMTHHPVTVHHPKPTVSLTPTQNVQMITATATVSKFGRTAHLTATFPENGGTVKGVISGDCKGTVEGMYSGDSNGKKLQGTASASCAILFFTISGTATYSGTVNTNDTAADIQYTAKGNGQTQSGTFTFTLTK